MEEHATRTQPSQQDQPRAAGDQAKAEPSRGSNELVIRLNKTYVLLTLVAILFYVAGYLTHSLLPFASGDGGGRTQPSSAAAQPQPQNPGGQAQTGEAVPSQGATGGPTTGEPERIAVEVGDAPFLGPADAPVTIVEFSDYQCPFCKRFRDQTFDQLLATYEGKVRFAYREFPLSSIHPEAQKASEAALCAGDQEQYWRMHDELFARQAEWANSPTAVDTFKAFAAEMGLDTDQFNECLDTDTYSERVLADFQDGTRYGVRGTPTFFINGRVLVGAQPLSAFQQIIDEELAGSEG